MRFLTLGLIAALTATPALSQGKLGKPAPSPVLRGEMVKVLGRAQPNIGREISPGMTLTAATSQGNTLVFMVRAANMAAVENGTDQTPGLSLQDRFVKTFGRKFCAPGFGARKFVDAGGKISIAATTRGGKLLAGGTLTRC